MSEQYIISIPEGVDVKKIKKVFKLADTPVEADYHGSGYGVLVLRADVPVKLVYLPDEAQGTPPTLPEQIVINLDTEVKDASVWLGMASCWEFCGMEEIL